MELTIRQHPSLLCSSFATMSRGNKAPIVGILSSSMRDNYDEFGVEEVREIFPLTLQPSYHAFAGTVLQKSRRDLSESSLSRNTVVFILLVQ